LRGKFTAKYKILTVLGAVFPHFCPDKGEFGTGSGPLAPRAKFHLYRGNVSRKKPFFRPLSKNNTGMAALCAGLPVIKYIL